MSSLYVETHDAWVYVGGGECVLKTIFQHSDCLRTIHLDSTYGNLYGILFHIIMSIPVAIFWDNYIAIKIPAILSNCLSIYLVYAISKELLGKENAKYGTMIYALSYITLYSTSVIGDDDSVFMFFMLLSTYALLRNKMTLAAVSFSLSLLLKLTPAAVLPPMLYYLLRKHGYKTVIRFAVMSSVIFLLFFIPHYVVAGEAALAPYTATSRFTISGVGFINIIRLSYGLPYYVLHPELPRYFSEAFPESPINYYGTNPVMIFIRQVSTGFLSIGLILLLYYLKKHPMRNIEVELIRNEFLFIFVILMFSKTVDGMYFQWFLPYLIMLFAYEIKPPLKEFKSTFYERRHEYNGFILILLAGAIFSKIFNWGSNISAAEKVLLGLNLLLVSVGTYMITKRLGVRKSLLLTGLTLAFAMDRILVANISTVVYPLFKNFITYDTFSVVTRYGWNYVNAVLVLIIAVLVFREVHNITKDL